MILTVPQELGESRARLSCRRSCTASRACAERPPPSRRALVRGLGLGLGFGFRFGFGFGFGFGFRFGLSSGSGSG